MSIKSLNSSYLTSTNNEVPIPTDWFDFKFKFMTSSLFKLWAVDNDTWAVILCSLPVTWSKLLSKKYSKLLLPIFVSPTNDNPVVLVVNPNCVTIPI